MTTDVRIIHAHDFIKASVDGQLDLEKSKELLVEVATASTSLADYEVLLDTRKTKSVMSITDLWYLAAELSNLGKAYYRKTAVLCPIENFDQAGFFALCATNRGFRVKAFTSFEEAIEWLIANGT